MGDEVRGIQRPDALENHRLVNRPQRLTDKGQKHHLYYLSIFNHETLTSLGAYTT